MQIGIFSDVHDHLAHLGAALHRFEERGLTTLIFCGDFCSPIPARHLARFEGTVHGVFGNGDGDRFAIERIAQQGGGRLVLHGEYAELTLGGVPVAVTHYPFYARALARTGDYRAVFSGHTHERHAERFGECLWVNPGEVLGWKGTPSCAVYDAATHEATFIDLR